MSTDFFDKLQAKWDAYFEYLESRGHKLTRNEDGTVDQWRVSGGYHNGPGCELCNAAWCQHCAPEVEECPNKEGTNDQR